MHPAFQREESRSTRVRCSVPLTRLRAPTFTIWYQSETGPVLFLSGIPLNLFRSEAEGLQVGREAGFNVVLSTRENRSLVQVVHKVVFTGPVLSIRLSIPASFTRFVRNQHYSGSGRGFRIRWGTDFSRRDVFKAHRLLYHCGYRTAEFEVASDIRGLRDQICTTFGHKVNCVRQIDFL